MLTWFRLWPLLVLPAFILLLLTSLPIFEIRSRLLGGGLVREWLLNHALLPVLPLAQAEQLIVWFANASVIQEWLLSLLIIININGILLFPLYFIGQLIIGFSAWTLRTELNIKRKSIR